MAFSKCFVVLAVCAVLISSQPVQQQLPVMKQQPSEVLFRTAPNGQPFLLECSLDGSTEGKQIQYSWHKNGQPFDWKTDEHIVQRKGEGSLVFLKPTEAIEGKYQCFAQSDVGTASSRVISVRRTYLNAPKITVQKHKPTEGKPYKLDCSVPDAYPKPSIVWHLQQEIDPSISHTILDKRISYVPEGTLYFTNVTKEDVYKGFKYVCLAKSPAFDDYVSVAEHMIDDLVESKVQNKELEPLYLSKDMTVKVGDVAMLYCIYGGTPLAHPEWFRDGKDVSGNPNDRVTSHNRNACKRLLIRETLPEDQGQYTCEVNNGVGKPQKHVIRLTVQSAPKFTKTPERQVMAKEGQDVTVPCVVQGTPAPKVSWSFNGKPLTPTNKMTLSPHGLVVKAVQKSDNGYYGCRAENANGDVYAESLVQVL